MEIVDKILHSLDAANVRNTDQSLGQQTSLAPIAEEIPTTVNTVALRAWGHTIERLHSYQPHHIKTGKAPRAR